MPETFPTCPVHNADDKISDRLVDLESIGKTEQKTEVEDNKSPLAKLIIAFIEFFMSI